MLYGLTFPFFTEFPEINGVERFYRTSRINVVTQERIQIFEKEEEGEREGEDNITSALQTIFLSVLKIMGGLIR